MTHSHTSPNPAFISPPTKIPWYLRLGLWVASRISGADLLPARLLAWYPKAAISSAVLEGLIAHQDGRTDLFPDKNMQISICEGVAGDNGRATVDLNRG